MNDFRQQVKKLNIIHRITKKVLLTRLCGLVEFVVNKGVKKRAKTTEEKRREGPPTPSQPKKKHKKKRVVTPFYNIFVRKVYQTSDSLKDQF